MGRARGKGWVGVCMWGRGNIIVKHNCTHHRASRCSISLRKFVWNLCKGSKLENMRLFSVSGMESSLLTVLWNHWEEKEATLRGTEMHDECLQFGSDAAATCARNTGPFPLGLQHLGGTRRFQASLLVPFHQTGWEAPISLFLLPATGYQKTAEARTDLWNGQLLKSKPPSSQLAGQSCVIALTTPGFSPSGTSISAPL